MTDARDEITERLLKEAGVKPGMRVLDVGCGQGIVSQMLAQLVGIEGQVLGVDRDPDAIQAAQKRLRELALPQVSFREGDLASIPREWGYFDAIIGRRVLMYQPAPVDSLRKLAASLKPGGIMIFQELDATMVPARISPMPLHERVQRWAWLTVEREGGNLHMGFDLYSVFTAAGFVPETIRAEAVVQTSQVPYDFSLLIRTMLPRILKHGVATEEEVAIDTLAERLAEERKKVNGTYVSDMVFGIWARKPPI